MYIYQMDFYFLNLNRSLKVRILSKKQNFLFCKDRFQILIDVKEQTVQLIRLQKELSPLLLFYGFKISLQLCVLHICIHSIFFQRKRFYYWIFVVKVLNFVQLLTSSHAFVPVFKHKNKFPEQWRANDLFFHQHEIQI